MTSSRAQGFGEELRKLAKAQYSTDMFGSQHEAISPAGWKQTLVDLPVVIGGTGLGIAAGKAVGQAVEKHLISQGKIPSQYLKYAPHAAGALSSLGSYMYGRVRHDMARRRREREEKDSKKPEK